jgi:hypothetical protein
MAKTNGITHSFQDGQLVWNINGLQDRVYEIVKITAKRIVCKDVGWIGDTCVKFHGADYAISTCTPENLFLVEPHLIERPA